MPSWIPGRATRFRLAVALLLGATACSGGPRPDPAPSADRATALLAGSDRFFSAAGVRLRYREIGAGDPIVLLHGFGQRLEAMSELADSLAVDHRVIVLDQRGSGESTKLSDPSRFGREMADDVVRLLDHLRISQAHLVGHSMGALVAANVAARHPSRVASVALVAGPFYPDSAAFAAFASPWIAGLERGDGISPLIAWLIPGTPDSLAAMASAAVIAENDVASLIAMMKGMAGLVVPAERLDRTRIPALIAVGTEDPLLPRSRELADRWRTARYLQVDGADHGEIITRPETLTAIRALLAASKARA